MRNTTDRICRDVGSLHSPGPPHDLYELEPHILQRVAFMLDIADLYLGKPVVEDLLDDIERQYGWRVAHAVKAARDGLILGPREDDDEPADVVPIRTKRPTKKPKKRDE